MDPTEYNAQMSTQGYKRTNFEEDDISNSSNPPALDFNAGVVFKGGLSLWQKKSILERVLFVLTIVLSISVIILAIVLASKQAHITYLQNSAVCLEPTCVQVSSSLLTAMDRSIDPCDDFYQYACGGWIKSHPIPSGHSRFNMFSVLWQANQVIMKHAIEQPVNASVNLSEWKAQTYYRSCMDENKTIEDLGAKPLLDLLKEEVPSWSISVMDSNFDLQDLLEKCKKYGVSTLFAVWVGEDDRSSTQNVRKLDQSGLGLPERDYYLNKSIDHDPVLIAYLEYMTEVGMLLGGEENSTRSQMTDVIMFETQLATITIPSEDHRDEEKMYNKITIEQLQQNITFINWLDIINSCLSMSGIHVTSSEKMVSYAGNYLQDMAELVNGTMRTERGRRTMYNYLMWHIIKSMTSYLSKPFRTAQKVLSEALSGTTGGEELWRECISDTDETLGFALGAMFIREAFNGDSKVKAEAMIDEVKTAFKNNLPNLGWMDTETRAAAVDKVRLGGHRDSGCSKTQAAAVDKLDIKQNEYFGNNMRSTKFQLTKNFEELRKTPKKNRWSMTPPTVNAYYTPTKNEIVLPAGVLQAPFYDASYPMSLNFGAIGVVMGHELTHGFDDQGREYDKNGNLRPWWNNQSVVRFQKRAECMQDQYSQYKLNGEQIKGKLTLGENIADNGGLKSAYHAYTDWISHHNDERPLPAINLTHRQLFFLGFSQVWCSTSLKEADHLQLLSDSHSPAKFRVIGTLSNSKEFAEEFKCPLGSRMNPKEKCEVW
ncbi:endothelin-converting enzyme homolog [Mizuhopecten yessoensis]|uniref:endothelin-converting enzyme homolog n=1 Tax=Mizuhopecten yessoensis TaxID=6573 RepID=UPI000B45CF0C|nr:endothelin-converting enzyme homolog [Mizuhopecten yessoensis]